MYLGYGLCSAWTAKTEDCRWSFTTSVTQKKVVNRNSLSDMGFYKLLARPLCKSTTSPTSALLKLSPLTSSSRTSIPSGRPILSIYFWQKDDQSFALTKRSNDVK